jgi:hypothetical protein
MPGRARASRVLPAPGEPAHQYVMTASGGDFEGAFDVFLALDFGEICWGEERRGFFGGGLELFN